tara:strand:- start:1146 stop:1412 length:267 start_codon:yes stop_codon:yes gene_type:complete
MKVMHHKEKIGVALTDEEMSLTIRALTTAMAVLSMVDKLGLSTGITESSLKWMSALEKDYRRINENYKQNKKKDKSIPTIQEDCEPCD